MENINILVVDDEEDIANLVEIHLVGEGYTIFKAYNALDGLDVMKKNDIKLAIIDIMMPGMDGITMVKKIRETSNIPIIMLSAKSTDLDKIVGLGSGADDYVSKPFNPLELTARVKSQLRRYTQFNESKNDTSASEIHVQNLTINKETHSVIAYDKEVVLTPTEFDIIYILASNPGKVFSTEEIFEGVWNEKMFDSNNTVMVHIRRIRGKIELDAKNPQIIKTVWGVGYKIEK